MFAKSETHAKEVFPSVILGEIKVIELFEDTKSFFIAPLLGGRRGLSVQVQAETSDDIQNTG